MKTMKKYKQDVLIFMRFMVFMVISAFINTDCMKSASRKAISKEMHNFLFAKTPQKCAQYNYGFITFDFQQRS